MLLKWQTLACGVYSVVGREPFWNCTTMLHLQKSVTGTIETGWGVDGIRKKPGVSIDGSGRNVVLPKQG